MEGRAWRFSAAPPPYVDEAPSSWICRVAHAHNLTVEELIELQGASASELDLGLGESVLADTALRSGMSEWPAVEPAVAGLVRMARLPDFRPRITAEEWWAYCPSCVHADLDAERVPYIRACWSHPLAMVCRRHGLRLRAWPRGREVLLADGRTFFGMFEEEDFRGVTATPEEIQWFSILARISNADWEEVVSLVVDLADGLMTRTGPQAQDRVALFQFADKDESPQWPGSSRLPHFGLGGLDAHRRLLVLRTIVQLLSYDPLGDTAVPSWLINFVRANARGMNRRTLGNVSADPLFLLMARLNPDAANALALRSVEWPRHARRRMGAAILIGALANQA